SLLFIFFFQAEDGIRDFHVTGVQTCALPICNAVDSSADAKSIFNFWTHAIKQSIAASKKTITALGIAMPGPFDYEVGISLMQNQDKYDQIYQKEINGDLKAILGADIDIRYINDAAAFLQGEVFAGALEDRPKILGITLGTGLGSAVWQKGEKAFDANLWSAPYKDRIFEEFLVTRWFTKRFFELSGIRENGFKNILQHHQDTDAFLQLMTEYTESLHDFLSFFSQKHQSNTFILGGNIAKAWGIIRSYKPEAFEDFEVFTGQYAEDAAIIGAASLFR